MQKLLQKVRLLVLLIANLGVLPTYGQNNLAQNSQKSHQAFIQKGTILTGFSFSFINSSQSEYNQDFPREITAISNQIDGLYFISDHIGIGPLVGYQFAYRDLVPYNRNSPDIDTRTGQLIFGTKVGYYLPVAKIFGGNSNINLFVDGGVSWLHNHFRRENAPKRKSTYELGFQLGSGLLFPVGKRIALQTILEVQARKHKYTLGRYKKIDYTHYKLVSTKTVHKWPVALILGVGLRVKF